MRSLETFRVTLRFLLLALAFLSASPVAFAQQYLFYVGTYTEHGSKGIYAYRFNATNGEMTSLGLAAEATQPSFLTIDAQGKFLYAVNETSHALGKDGGAVTAFAVHQESGKLTQLNQVSSGGADPAYIVLDKTGKYALVANYSLGSVAVFPLLKDGQLGAATAFVLHHGSSVDHERQGAPHAHAIALSPDDRFAIVADLGLDQLLAYRFDHTRGTLAPNPQITKTAPGAGPRHLIFSRDGRFLYVINEIQSTVVVYSYDAGSGTLHELQSLTTLPKTFRGENTTAEIDIDPSGKFLFGSNRGDDSMAVFAVDSKTGMLTPVETDSVAGKEPRNFSLDPTGTWLLSADQNSDKIVVFHLDAKTGHLTPTSHEVQLSSPVCIQFVKKPLPN